MSRRFDQARAARLARIRDAQAACERHIASLIEALEAMAQRCNMYVADADRLRNEYERLK